MIRLIYAGGEKKGQLFCEFKDVQEFCQESIRQVSMVAYENKLDQRSVFSHYGFEVVTTPTGANGFKNGILASMNFWLDSVPDTIMEYDSGETEDAKEKAFYKVLNQIANVPGMLTFRTSNDLWFRYRQQEQNFAQATVKIWEPTTAVPEEVLQDYPRVGAMLEAAGLLANDDQRVVKAGEWAFQELLNGAELKRTVKVMRDVAASASAKLPDYVCTQEPNEEIYAIIYAFLQGKFYEELQTAEETK